MKQSGFSLLELSIVLVIIGLIAGGIVAGSAMIRAAELRSVITEYQQYQTAVNTFRDKYLGLPGDLKNATAFWGAAHATPATCLTTAGTGTQTCDGNGNNQIEPATAASQYGEMFTFWQHLANAELIAGSFTGIAGAGAQEGILGTTIPEAKISGAGWTMLGNTPYRPFAGDAVWFAGNYGNFLSFGTKLGSTWTWGAVVAAEEVWNIDTKIDDGRPGTGNIFVGFYEACTDRTAGQSSTANAQAAEYNLTNEDVACGLIFRNVF